MFTYPNKIIAVSSRALCPRSLEEQAERISQAGIKRLILREKDLSEDEYTALAKRVKTVCDRCGIELVIHFYPQAARELGIKALHMPYSMLTEELCREFDITGTSVHSVEEAISAERIGADYITAGHIFATDCKKGLAPRGTDFLREVCGNVKIPVFAIGGISESNFDEIISSGAQGGCIMSGAMKL